MSKTPILINFGDDMLRKMRALAKVREIPLSVLIRAFVSEGMAASKDMPNLPSAARLLNAAVEVRAKADIDWWSDYSRLLTTPGCPKFTSMEEIDAAIAVRKSQKATPAKAPITPIAPAQDDDDDDWDAPVSPELAALMAKTKAMFEADERAYQAAHMPMANLADELE